MTNAEKYLKDGVDIEELVKEIEDYVDKKYKEEYEWFHSVPLFRYLRDFFNIDLNKPIKPQLTEDERVILRNIKNGFSIERDADGDLLVKIAEIDTEGDLLVKAGEEVFYISMYNGLFQFIKNGEEYSIEELLNG